MYAPTLRSLRAQQFQEEHSRRLADWFACRPEAVIARAPNPHLAAIECTAQNDGGVYVGVTPDRREWTTAAREQAVLVLGPPRSGKTTALIIPAILSAPGAVVVTSTKHDVLHATASARGRMGTLWVFDPSGSQPIPPNARALHWTPVNSASTWDGARAIADAMVDASQAGVGVENSSHWTESAKALLAPLLRAAYVSGKTIVDVRHWVSRPNEYGKELYTTLVEHGQRAAADDLAAILLYTDERQRSAICATTRIVLNVYGSDSVAAASQKQNFDAAAFVSSRDTVYITSPSDKQHLCAPLVVGLLEEIKRAAYQRHADARSVGRWPGPSVFWALDEVANIAPIKRLPSIISEGGGQGLQVMACFQDLSQARGRWHDAADGFLTLFSTKVVFPGIGDVRTLEALSTLAGDWDRPYVVYNASSGRSVNFGIPIGVGSSWQTGQSVSNSVQREHQLTPATLANIPTGHALFMSGGSWRLIQCTPFYSHQPWQDIASGAFLNRPAPQPLTASNPAPNYDPYLRCDNEQAQSEREG
ncbi:type IV secretory system conjugative DNA transfer family protein [Kineococcus xinjiangensis]|nr:type IV secretory system conjugative DNA transfer family protein [Kineococcus xinjiangensis]